MKSVLPKLPKPSRYLGIEEGAIHKNNNEITVHMALAFPDMYEVAMSYLGQKILYDIVNSRQTWWAERVFAPCIETSAILQEYGLELSSLESMTPLRQFDIIGFSMTHDMCYATMLYMLDMAKIPFYSKERGEEFPILLAGGSTTYNPAILSPFFDALALGEGEELLVEILEIYEYCKQKKYAKLETLKEMATIDGVYIPAFHTEGKRYIRRVVQDMDACPYPEQQIVPFGAIHNRLSLEIARGCTRGCRFCQAGVIYRPLRERSVATLEDIIDNSLDKTGYDEVSLLSLSTGDFSALRTLFHSTFTRCAEHNIAVGMPSQRVGSIDESIFKAIASVRKTGATLAPEAGSQRLRNVICKGVTEEELLQHARILALYGWKKIKLYFMIGLPTETYEDRVAIIELASKVRYATKSQLEVTISLSPYVPKPHTPFQWEQQISKEEFEQYISYFIGEVKHLRGVSLRWHAPAMSMVEGLFSRGDERIAPVLVEAYKRGSIFPSWNDSFSEIPYLEALAMYGLTVEEFLREREETEVLPWDCVEIGVSREFLIRERRNAYKERVVEDCHYNACVACKACDTKHASSLLQRGKQETFKIITNFTKRDQIPLTLPTVEPFVQREYTQEERLAMRAQHKAHKKEEQERARIAQEERDAKRAESAELLGKKAQLFRIWHTKLERSAYLSQLELQEYFFRMLRKGNIETSFSRGYSPTPLITFGRALPVGLQSYEEWFSIFVRSEYTVEDLYQRMQCNIEGIDIVRIENIPLKTQLCASYKEEFVLRGVNASMRNAFESLMHCSSRIATYTHKNKERTVDIPTYIKDISIEDDSIYFTGFWEEQYVAPTKLMPLFVPPEACGLLYKIRQYMD